MLGPYNHVCAGVSARARVCVCVCAGLCVCGRVYMMLQIRMQHYMHAHARTLHLLPIVRSCGVCREVQVCRHFVQMPPCWPASMSYLISFSGWHVHQ